MLNGDWSSASSFCRYEDNGDAVNNLVVITQKTDKSNITDFGAPDKFLQQVQYLLGEQVFAGRIPWSVVSSAVMYVQLGNCLDVRLQRI